MVFEKCIRYAGLAVGLKPSATECEARLRGLERIIKDHRLPASPCSRPRRPGATPTALPPRAGNQRLVEGRRPSTPLRRKATA